MRRLLGATLAAATLVRPAPAQGPAEVAALLRYPFPSQLVAARTAPRLAWVLDQEGRREVWTASSPDFAPRLVAAYPDDDGQEISQLQISPDGRWAVWVRGGEHGSNWDESVPVNPASRPLPPRALEIWAAPLDGGPARRIAEGDEPVLSPDGRRVVFARERALWLVPVDGSAAPERIVAVAGALGEVAWAPDGQRFAFVADRGPHALIGVYEGADQPIRWIAPSPDRDGVPRWSPDGTRLVFVRRPGRGGPPDSLLAPRPQPWEIWVAEVASGRAQRLWRSPERPEGNLPTTHGGPNLHWANGAIVFLSYHDGWPHLYALPERGGEPRLLTPGPYMVEYVHLGPDGRSLLAAANTGPDRWDVDRRHILRVRLDGGPPEVLTPGVGIEWNPVLLPDGRTFAYLGATPQRPPLVAVQAGPRAAPRWLQAERLPADFPTARLVVPRPVVFPAPDGTPIHAQLFEAPGGPAKKPAVVYVHGGPMRQMLLGWHYSSYYAHAYAVNQALALAGFVVLSVNYRLGIGYGYAFHFPPNGGLRGASEYQDIRAAGLYLRSLPQVDPRRIGLWGGSYGGYLTALGLARDSELFAAGVDLHGVHDWTSDSGRRLGLQLVGMEIPADRDRALRVAWESSPVAWVARWRSPVLLVHGDDDRNVRVDQTVDLVQRLRRAGVPFEVLLVPDDTHHWLRYANRVRVSEATVEFLRRTLSARGSGGDAAR